MSKTLKLKSFYHENIQNQENGSWPSSLAAPFFVFVVGSTVLQTKMLLFSSHTTFFWGENPQQPFSKLRSLSRCFFRSFVKRLFLADISLPTQRTWIHGPGPWAWILRFQNIQLVKVPVGHGCRIAAVSARCQRLKGGRLTAKETNCGMS